MKKSIHTSFLLSALSFVPIIAFAQAADLNWFVSVVTSLQSLVNQLIPLVVALALLFFFWGIVQFFILGAGNEEKRATGRAYMVYGFIGLTAIVAVWGLVDLLIGIVGIDPSATFDLPTIPTIN